MLVHINNTVFVIFVNCMGVADIVKLEVYNAVPLITRRLLIFP